MLRNDSDDVVHALADAPIDPRTGNRVLYSVNWVATNDSMIGEVNEDWVRRELAWFNSGSDKLDDMEGPVPALFKACAGWDGKVNSAYGYILFGQGEELPQVPTLYDRVLITLLKEGLESRHAVAIITDRNIHHLANKNGRKDFICTNALNVMVDHDNRVHIIAQMRSMDAVFGYRADYSMWDDLMKRLVIDLNNRGRDVRRGDITFQVANLHVYPRHFDLLAKTADAIYDKQEREMRQVWRDRAATVGETDPHADEPEGTGEDGIVRRKKPGFAGRPIADRPQA